MKKFIKIVIPILMVLLIIASAYWYLFVFDRPVMQELFLYSARRCTENGNYTAAAWFYQQAYTHSGQSDEVALELANAYLEEGNFTKAEYTLSSAISDGATADLYIMLCKTYVMQDKLLDAVNMLDKISDPQIKAEINAQRPEAPGVTQEPGFYNQYIHVEFTYSGGTLYYTTNGEYPTQDSEPYSDPIPLSGGETLIYAVVVAEDGLVSPVAIYGYTVGGVVEPVELTDPAVDAAVRSQLNLSASDTLYTSDLWTITDFTVPEEAATLEDLRYMTYLRSLTITGSDFTGSEALASLQQLETLIVQDSTVRAEHLTVIASLPRLTGLTLSHCGLTTIANLANAQSLVQLDLSRNTLQNIDVISSMYLLEDLNLSDNALTSLSALTGLNSLKTLNVSSNSLADISAVCALVKLEWLDVSHNSLTSLGVLDNLSSLYYLNASHNTLSDISVLADCDALQELNLSNNTLTSIEPVTDMDSLLYLDVSYNFLTELPQFDTDCALVNFSADNNYLTDITPLGGLKSLNNVYVENNSLTDISCLANCINLVRIHAYGNPIPMEIAQPLIDMGVIVQYNPTLAAAAEASEAS